MTRSVVSYQFLNSAHGSRLARAFRVGLVALAGCTAPAAVAPSPPEPVGAATPAEPVEDRVVAEPAVVAPAVEPEAPADKAVKAKTPAATDSGEPRVYAPAGLIKIHEKPDRDAPVIGAFRAGQSVVLKSTELPRHRTFKRLYQCTDGWYEVQPRGFVCVGGEGHATLEPNDPAYIAAAAVLPDLESDYPFKYGVAIATPQYKRIPTREEQLLAEPGLEAHLANLPPPDDANGGAIDATPSGKPPSEAFQKYLELAQPPLRDPVDLYDGYKISWSHEFDAEGRTWLLTPDMTLVPKDKVRQKPLPTLKGIDLRAHPEIELPLVFFWLEDSFKYVRGDDGKLVATEEKWKRHSFVQTSMNQEMGPGGIYWETKDGGFVKYQDVTLIRPVAARPAGVGPDDKWVEVRVTWGTLVAYEGDTPVYVAAISPGVDGINAGKHATARGKQYVDWKLYSGDMSGRDKGKDWYVDEVPWVQYYYGNYAVHGAWWHDNFGRPMSHGCINLTAADARHLFNWMDPVIPAGWYAVSTYHPHNKSTMIYVRH